MYTLASIRNSIDTSDEFYDGEMKYYNEKMPVISEKMQQYKKLVLDSEYREYFEEKLGKVAFKNAELEQKAFNEEMISDKQEENNLTLEYDKLIASAKIPWGDEELNLSGLRKYMEDTDRDIRRKAYGEFSKFFLSHEKELDEIYDKLVKCRTKQGKLGAHVTVPYRYHDYVITKLKENGYKLCIAFEKFEISW